MAPSPTKGKKWMIALLAALFVVLAVGAVLMILGGRGLSARYDDAEAMLRDYDSSQTPALSAQEDGSVHLRLTREDLYWYARRYGLLDDLRRQLAEAGVTAAGFRLSDGRLTVYARYRTWGFLPLSYQASASLTWEDGLVLRTEKLSFGNHMTIPRSRWPEIFSRPFRIPADRISPLVRDACLDGDALILSHEGLAVSLAGSLRADPELLHAMGLFGLRAGEDDLIESFVFSHPGEELSPEAVRALLSAETREDAFAELLSLAGEWSAGDLWPGADLLTMDMLIWPLQRAAGERRETLDAALAAEQARYEKLLLAVRESYKSGGLAIAETGFVSVSSGQPFDPAALTTLSASSTDCRIVFLYGSLGGGEFCSRDMPRGSDVARAGKKVMVGLLDPDAAYDLGVTLTSEGGTPLLIYRRADDAFVLREIGEAQYVSLLVERSNPVLDMDLLPAPGELIERPAGEGWSGAVILTEPKG